MKKPRPVVDPALAAFLNDTARVNATHDEGVHSLPSNILHPASDDDAS